MAPDEIKAWYDASTRKHSTRVMWPGSMPSSRPKASITSSPPGILQGIDGVKTMMGKFHAGFPDLHITVDDRIEEHDRVAARWRMTGTHTGTFLGMPPTGQRFSMQGISILRIEDGKVAEAWIVGDQLSMLRQLGFLPAQVTS